MAQAVIGALRVTLGMDSAAFTKGMKNASSRLSTFGKTAAKGMAVVGAAGAAAAAGVGLAVKGILNDADNMAKSARKIGVPVDELSRLRHAADLSGVSMGGLENGLKRLSANMFDASQGIGEGAKAFKELGIDVSNSDGSLKSSTQIMGEIAAKFKTMPDGAEKTALAMKLMGKSGADMIPLLNGGRDALQSMIDEADKMGLVITPDMAANAEAFNDNMTRVSGAVKGLSIQLTASLAPVMASISDKIVALVNGFQVLSPGTQRFIGIAAALTAGITALAIPLGALVLTFGAISVPVLAAVAAIAAITAGVVAFWPEIQRLWEGLTGLPDKIVSVFQNMPDDMMEIGSNIIAGLWSGLSAKWNSVKNRVTGIAGDIKASFVDFFKIQSPSRVMMEVGSNIVQGLANGMTSSGAKLDDVANRLSTGVGSAFQTISSNILSVIDGTKSWKDAALDAANSILSSILDSSVSQIGSGLGGLFSSFGASIFGVPSFEGGGFTGMGSRTGGLDGRGGGLAVVHPNETIIDHKKTSDFGPQHVTVGIAADGNGNLMPFVQSVSQQVAGQVLSQAAPAMTKQAVSASKSSFRNQTSQWRQR